MAPYVIGISGGSGSGKSTLAQAVRDALADRCVHIAHDDYYRSLPERWRADPASYNFDEPAALETDLLVDHLAQLRAGKPATLPTYDFASHTRSGSRDVAPAEVVLVEGILLFAASEVLPLLDLRVFVHAPASIRRERRLARDVQERGREPAWVAQRFDAHVEPMHQAHVEPSRAHAHLVVDGTGDLDASVQAILERLRAARGGTIRHHTRRL